MPHHTYYGTDYLETEAILAAQDGNIVELKRILEKMSPDERRRLARASDTLSAHISAFDERMHT